MVLPLQKFKSKSAHDVLQDESLSKESAVQPEELGGGREYADVDSQKEELGRIREKFAKKKRKSHYDDTDRDEDDLEKAINDQREEERKAELYASFFP